MNFVQRSWRWMAGAITTSFAFFGATLAFAQTNITLTNPLGSSCTDLSCIITDIQNIIFTISIPICTIMVLIGGFKMLTSSGDPEKFKEGRQTILYAAAGFAVVLLAGAVAGLVQQFFTTG